VELQKTSDVRFVVSAPLVRVRNALPLQPQPQAEQLRFV